MKPIRYLLLSILAVAGLATTGPTIAHAAQNPADVPQDVAAYPLDTCVVSGKKLGSMGKPYDYVHRQEGQPDRLVRFCCRGCVGAFKKDPDRYLQLLDAAAARVDPDAIAHPQAGVASTR
ncbi:MAG: hypothetical protein KIT44_03275 [Opitutaceae bacterium]|nr:hypothetical protein [Opitutaceae bacterium]